MTVATAGELRVTNPATLETVGVVDVVRPTEVGSLAAAARAAQAGWCEAGAGERRALLRRLTEVVLDRADEIADVVVAETAKPRIEAFTSEIFPALDALAWLAAEAPKLL